MSSTPEPTASAPSHSTRPAVDAAPEQLIPLIYDELRGLARQYFRKERSDHTLQPTALVHEAYLRLADQHLHCQNRSHFLALCARAMRQVLVDHARSRKRVKRGGGRHRIEVDSRISPTDLSQFEILALHEAIETLSQLDARQGRIVELRFFGGLTVAEIAEVLNVSKRTVEGDWQHAKAWLRATMSETPT